MELVSRQEALAQGLKRYFTGKPCKRGHIAERTLPENGCAECARLRSSAYRAKDLGASRRRCVEAEREFKVRDPEAWAERRRLIRQRVRDKHGLVKYLYSQIRFRAKRRGLEFTITRDDIVVPTHCPILGIPLIFTEGHHTDNSPSLDRIDNLKGYIPGNVHVISWRANRIKCDATPQELQLVADYFKRATVPIPTSQ